MSFDNVNPTTHFKEGEKERKNMGLISLWHIKIQSHMILTCTMVGCNWQIKKQGQEFHISATIWSFLWVNKKITITWIQLLISSTLYTYNDRLTLYMDYMHNVENWKCHYFKKCIFLVRWVFFFSFFFFRISFLPPTLSFFFFWRTSNLILSGQSYLFYLSHRLEKKKRDQ